MTKKLEIKKLGYPLWFTILFYSLTILIPIILIMIEGLQAPNENGGLIFKYSFMVISIGIVAWFFIKKFLIKNLENKLIAKQTALEHDYSIDNGNLNKIKYLWYQNEMYLSIFNMITILLYGGLICIILVGVAEALMKIKGIVMLIAILYVVAYTLKFIYILTKRSSEDYE